MPNSIEWAPFVYTRTKLNDFALLAAPPYLSAEERTWIELAASAATRYAAGLEDAPRRAAFWLGDLTAFGIACYVEDISGVNDPVARVGSTANYIFAGYCTRAREAVLPPLSDVTVSAATPHLDILRQRWNEPRGGAQVTPTASSYSFGEVAGRNDAGISLNDDPQRVHAYADTPANRDALWSAAAVHSRSAHVPFAIYLGMTGPVDVTRLPAGGGTVGRIFNATVREMTHEGLKTLELSSPRVAEREETPSGGAPHRRTTRPLRGTAPPPPGPHRHRLNATPAKATAGTVGVGAFLWLLFNAPRLAVLLLTAGLVGAAWYYGKKKNRATPPQEAPPPVPSSVSKTPRSAATDLARSYRRPGAAAPTAKHGENDWK